MINWEEIKKLLSDYPNQLKLKDIEADINWLYTNQNKSKPSEIKVYKSMKALRKDNDLEYEDRFYGLYNELEFYTYWKDQTTIPEDIKRYIEFLSKGIFYAVFKSDKALICMFPKQISLDKDNDFHSTKEASILWHDGSCKYFIHGLRYDKELFNKVKDLNLTKEQINNADPIEELTDNENNYHSLKQASKIYENQKSEYYIHGVRFSKGEWNQLRQRKMTVKRILNLRTSNQMNTALSLYGRDRIITEFSVKEVLEIQNIERRHTMLKYFGKEKILNELPTTLIHKSKRGNELYKIVIDDHLTAQILLYKCPSTQRQYSKFVNHHKDYTNADHAMAESHNMTLEQYKKMEHEG